MANYDVQKGYSSPLGVSTKEKGFNFALFSQHAEKVTLSLFAPKNTKPFLTVILDPDKHRTGWIWHALISGLPPHVEYSYQLEGPKPPQKKLFFNPSLLLSDPYAVSLNTWHRWGEKPSGTESVTADDEEAVPLGRAIIDRSFDWGNDAFPKIPDEDLVIYEMHVRGFTKDSSSKVKHPGTFLGIIEKIPYLKKLGVNAIELLPVFEFDECEYEKLHLPTGQKLTNFWGYSTINFFSPMNRYASCADWGIAIHEFKTMVKEMHKNGIEVILDVVYNHTAEGGLKGPNYSFRGIDNPIYYLVDEEGNYRDYTGCGNTMNANHPVTAKLILDSLRYWVNEMHVDGFRFDLASALTRNQKGVPLQEPFLIEAISTDPVLSNAKLIAEAWDVGGLYQVGCFPHYGRWAEWNGQYRDVVRKFIKGTEGEAGNFSKVISGSQHLYWYRDTPSDSINFVTAHDGFTLGDLVSYQQKHNEENGEENRDGANDNNSWNCGFEGPTKDNKILALRERQRRNFHLALMLSLGIPMILMGDEYGHTRGGNNNAWCQDNELNWFLWDELEKNKHYFRFYSSLIKFRRNEPLLRRKTFLSDGEVDWHGTTPLHPNWGNENRLVAYTLKDAARHQPLYIAFNAGFDPVHLQLPQPPKGKQWRRIVDTSLSPPEDFVDDPAKHPPLKLTYDLPPYSALLAKAF